MQTPLQNPKPSVTRDQPTQPSDDGLIPHFSFSDAKLMLCGDDEKVVIRGYGWVDADQSLVPLAICTNRSNIHEALDHFMDAATEDTTGETHALDWVELPESLRLSMLRDTDDPTSRGPVRTFHVASFCSCVD